MNDVIPFDNSAGPLVIFEDARREIAEAETPEQVKRIRDIAIGIAAAARAASDHAMEAEAKVLELIAQRKLGQIMQAQKEKFGLHRGGRPKTGLSENPVSDQPVTLAEVGIDKNLAHAARTAAAMSESEFETAKETTRATRAAPKRISKDPWAAPKNKRRSAKEIEHEQGNKSAGFVKTAILEGVLGDTNKFSDATIDCLCTKYIDDLVEIARHPKFGRVVAAVAAKLGVNELEKSSVPKVVSAAPIEVTTVTGALTVLLNFGRLGLKDLAGEMPNTTDLIELAKNLNDLAAELKRQKKPAIH